MGVFNLQILRRLSLAISIAACGTTLSAERLRIGGTGVALGSMQVLSRAYMAENPGIEIEVLPSLGSSGGVKALAANAIDLSLTSRPLKEREQGFDFIAQKYATTALAVVTSPEIEVSSINKDELEAIYAGETTLWPDGSNIRIVTRPASESDTKTLRGLSEGMSAAVDAAFLRPGLIIARTDQQNAEALEQTRGSIGFIAVGQIATENLQLNVLALDNVAPAVNAEYPLTKSLYIISPNTIGPHERAFIEFVFSKRGSSILRDYNHTPVQDS
jgi:phosphate transport system substrate-binding protein